VVRLPLVLHCGRYVVIEEKQRKTQKKNRRNWRMELAIAGKGVEELKALCETQASDVQL